MKVLLVFVLGLACGLWKTGIFTLKKIQNELKNPTLVEKNLTPETFAKKYNINQTDAEDSENEPKTENNDENK